MTKLFDDLEPPIIMGILNVTPDSFSDGQKYYQYDSAIRHAETLIKEGAQIIDIGGESTRPGAEPVSVNEEIDRVIPLAEKLKSLGCIISVDTNKPEVMKAAAETGVDMINDVMALSSPGAIEVMAKTNLSICLMHMQGKPQTMQMQPTYTNVVSEVKGFLQSRIQACISTGIDKSRLCIDPGFGFGKTLPHNLELLKELKQFESLGCPVLAGLSRKSMLGQITGNEINERLAASLAVALVAMQQGAQIIRVHDVKQTVDVKKVFLSLQ
jgi:dihydropteroate synthase